MYTPEKTQRVQTNVQNKNGHDIEYDRRRVTPVRAVTGRPTIAAEREKRRPIIAAEREKRRKHHRI